MTSRTLPESQRPTIEYPFPLKGRDGEVWMACLILPTRGLHGDDAERLKAFIDSLVTDEP